MRFLLFVLLACSSALAQPVMPFSPSSGGGGGAKSDPLACKVAGLADCQMLAQIRGNAGTASLPSFASPLANANNDGLYFPASGTLALAVDGVLRLSLTGTSMASSVALSGPLGTASAPTYTFAGDTDTGLFSGGTNTVQLSAAGVARITVDSSSVTSSLRVLHPSGGVTSPSMTFTGDTSTGIYRLSAGRLGVASLGVAVLEVSSTGQLLPAATSDAQDIGAATADWKRLFIGTSIEGSNNGKALQFVDLNGLQLTANRAQMDLQAGGNIVAQQETVGANGAPVLRLPAFANTSAASVGANLGCSSAAPGAVVVVDDSSSTSTKICVCARVAGVYAYRAIDNLANTCTGM